MSGRPHFRDWRRRDWAVALVVLALFVVPALVVAFGDKPGRFGFQMYSGYGLTEATWQDADGDGHPVDLADHLASTRVEIDWLATLPETLCDRLPDAVEVTVSQERTSGEAHRSVTC